MFGGPIGGSAAKANNNSELMLDTRVKCADGVFVTPTTEQWDEITIFGSLHLEARPVLPLSFDGGSIRASSL